MSYFLKSGNTFKVSSKEALDLHEHLPVGTYTVGFDKMAGCFFLEKIENFELKGKIYGNSTRNADRILRTFKDRTASTGVMLTGEKGSGKTLLTKQIAIDAAKDGISTIVINQPWCGEGFNSFMQMIEQPAIVLFDEFEKVYDGDDQEKMLTLLDGVYPSKKLFLLTCNDKWRVDRHMRNRPGRVYYMIEFKGLEQDFIIEYCEDNLKAKEHIQTICRVASLFSAFNFDMLKAMVEEMNRYGETPQEVLKLLNARPEFGDDSKYKVELQIGGVEVDGTMLEQTEWHGNPLTKGVALDYKVVEKDENGEEDWDWKNTRFTSNDLKQVDSKTNKFVFMNETGARLVLTKLQEKTWQYNAF
jgi:ATPase family associated with various cellular activities (AAA)